MKMRSIILFFSLLLSGGCIYSPNSTVSVYDSSGEPISDAIVCWMQPSLLGTFSLLCGYCDFLDVVYDIKLTDVNGSAVLYAGNYVIVGKKGFFPAVLERAPKTTLQSSVTLYSAEEPDKCVMRNILDDFYFLREPLRIKQKQKQLNQMRIEYFKWLEDKPKLLSAEPSCGRYHPTVPPELR
ncbi:MAG: hypothetical protein FWG50_07750 [Kiritimatiellaeota bacterium]|nr:hypothetical protein [Kiritimatiellota bacterium]